MAGHTRKSRAMELAGEMRRLAVAEAYRQEMEYVQRNERSVKGLQDRIAARLGVCKATVSKQLAKIRAAMPAVTATAAEEVRQAILRNNQAARERLEQVRAEITAEWHRSKQNAETTTIEQDVIETKHLDGTVSRVATGTGKVRKIAKGQTGNPAYTAQMVAIEAQLLALDKELRDLFGIDAPKKIEMTVEEARAELARELGMRVEDLPDAEPTVH